ncbi:MAG: hypothetical protein DI562_06650 [Stenotrophomonas acidaminiphila]|nr:MAG: hypothetical protein DI562_06650 [Stenotrophomonas acidaminiphila]
MAARILALSLLVLALAGCGGKNEVLACRTAAQCLDDWRQHYNEPALAWLQANRAPSRRLAIKLLLSSRHEDRDLGVWLVNLAGLDDDAGIHRVVGSSLKLGPEAAAIYKTPSAELPSLEETMRLVMQAPRGSDVYAGLAGRYGMDAVMAVEQQLRCRPSCERLDPAQASVILSSARSKDIRGLPLSDPRRDVTEQRVIAPFIALAEDEQASDMARMEAALLVARRTWDPSTFTASPSLSAFLRKHLTAANMGMRRDAALSILSLVKPLTDDDWERIAGVLDAQALSLDVLPLNLFHDSPPDGAVATFLWRRLAGKDTREALIALRLLSDFEARAVIMHDTIWPLLSNPDPELAALSGRILFRAGTPVESVEKALASHWFPATLPMFGGSAPWRARQRDVRNSTCLVKKQLLSEVTVNDTLSGRHRRKASRRLRTEVSHAVEHDGTLVAAISHGEFGGYLAVLRDGQPAEILGHEPFGPLLHLDGNRFLVTSGVAHMGSLAGDVYELHVGPVSSTMTHRLGGLSMPLALERQDGRILLSTYAFGVMDMTDLSAPRWLGCQRPPVGSLWK